MHRHQLIEAYNINAGESYKLWLEHESRTDDITIIIVHKNTVSSDYNPNWIPSTSQVTFHTHPHAITGRTSYQLGVQSLVPHPKPLASP